MGAHSNVEEWTVVAVNKTKAKIKAGGVAFGVAVGPYDVSSVELAGAMGSTSLSSTVSMTSSIPAAPKR